MVANKQVEEAGVNNKEDKEARKRELEQKQDDEVRALLTPGVIVTCTEMPPGRKNQFFN